MAQKQVKNSSYFSSVSTLLDVLFYKLKKSQILRSRTSKVDLSDSLFWVEKAKTCWLSGNEEETANVLRKARESYYFERKKVDPAHPESDKTYLFVSELVDSLESNDKNGVEKNRIAMLLWLNNVWFIHYLRYDAPHRFLLLYITRFIVTISTNGAILFFSVALIYSFIQFWKISVFSFIGTLLSTAIYLLVFRRFPNLLVILMFPVIVMLLFFVAIKLSPVIAQIVRSDPTTYTLLLLFLPISLMMLSLFNVIIRSHFQGIQYGKLSYISLRRHKENGKTVWEFVIVDTSGNIVKVCKSRFRYRAMYPFTNLASTVTIPKEMATMGVWHISPLFLFNPSNPSKRMPKTSGLLWWLKSHGLWFATIEQFYNPAGWEYTPGKTCSFIPLDKQSSPIFFKHAKKAGIEFSDEEIAEFLSRLPSPLQDPPGYAEYVASHGIEER